MASFPDVQRVSKCSASAERARMLRQFRLAIATSAAISNAACDADVAYLELATLQGDLSASHRAWGGGA
jgi:hypothetical protein